ncbi:hypothetical protein ACTFIU_004328 [Dictyostelium citrinum]
MSVTVDYLVHMTHDHTNDTSIGTDGLGTCVGIIARLNNGNTYCGHLSCEMQGIAANVQTITERTQTIMNERLNPINVASLHVATTSNGLDTNAMITGIQNTYPAIVVTRLEGTGLYWDGNNVAAINNSVIGTTQGPTDDQGPLNVTN